MQASKARQGAVNGAYAHGQAPRGRKTPEYRIWCGMVTRCTNRRLACAHNYALRGITICERWRGSFAAFLADVGPRPSPGHSIDRIDNDRGYEPGNCRWATAAEQQRNTRRNKLLTLNGRTMCVADWAAELGISRYTIFDRLRRGYTPEKALTVGDQRTIAARAS